MAFTIGEYTITSLEEMHAYNVETGDFMWTMDELQNATISHSEDKVEITGKQGRILNTIKRNKKVTISAQNGYLVPGALATQLGTEFETADVDNLMWTEIVTVNGAAAATTYTAVGTAGAEIVYLAPRGEGGVAGAEYEQASAVGANKFKYTPGTKALAFDSTVADGTKFIVKYKRKVNAQKLINNSGKYASKVMLFVDVFAEDKCNKTYRGQFYFPAVDANGTFDLEFGDNQLVHNFEGDALSGSCGGEAGTYYEFYLIESDAADVA